ncbi:DUF4139 domain-containing protein [Nitratireductor sp. ZSWI3]|uniref:DUF4139 domain-containing protein n=1 Tax=Nitratireductor sp. ZSWI3 TaxID=2966359 RepID=UPI002150070C|nr:DUF4139 domain-containing protein [Nitratireductor sp. ZSWI3]MCR4266935.1 DUF4139 domain-containing protein [Nitratireductor sp. ZSWI3]
MKTFATVFLASRTAMLCATVAVPLAAGAAEAVESRVEAITLSSGGLAEIRRSARVEGAGALEIDVPLEQVDDILKSLVVRDPSGRVGGLTLDGLSPVEETFRRLPFRPQEMGSLPDLAAALQGVRVRAASGGRTVEGTVLGVGRERTGTGDDIAEVRVLSVMTDAGQVEALRLGTDSVFEILDASMRDKLREAAEVSGRGRTDDMRRIAIALAGEEARAVGISYVVPAPVWKTAYRLVSREEGDARLQAWAVIENATGEDWNDVAVILSSGAPVTLAQRLHQRYWHQRPEVPVTAGSTTPPRPDDAAERKAEFAQDNAGGAARLQRQALVAAPAPSAMAMEAMMAPPDGETVGQEGQTTATYRLPFPVALKAGQTLSLPFIDAEVPAERVSVFQPERREIHPVVALLLENGTEASLPPGILTVYDEQDGYVGDAQLAGIPSGESRMVSFAADRKVEITTTSEPQETVGQIAVVDGTLRATTISRLTTTYSIKGAADARRTIVVEHPRRDGWRITSEALSGSTPTHHRLRATVAAGGAAEIRVTAERSRMDSFALVNADAEALFGWSGAAADPQMAAKLGELADLRRQSAAAEMEMSDIEEAIARMAGDQTRIRDNLAAAPRDSALAQRYLSMLEKTEDEIAALNGRRDAAEARFRALKENVAEFIRSF